jgi:hypothetical protein
MGFNGALTYPAIQRPTGIFPEVGVRLAKQFQARFIALKSYEYPWI